MAEQFGLYRLDELIGRGSMGEVHRAFDTVKQRTVALKHYRSHSPTTPGSKPGSVVNPHSPS